MKLKTLLFCGGLFLAAACTHEGKDSVVVLQTKLKAHPRLLFVEQDEARLKQLGDSDAMLNNLRRSLFKEADRLLTAEPQQYKTDLLSVSREQVFRMITLGLAYRFGGDKRYLDKAEAELNNVCDFADWHPDHYLDVAEMTTAVAIAYDWLYDDLSAATKSKVVASIKTKALDLVIREYATGDDGSWAKRNTNWNVVCNAGMVLGALAIAENYPDICAEVVNNAVKYVPNCIEHFAPDGVCYEGPAYWNYTNIYFAELLRALEDNFGQSFGLADMQGVSQAALTFIRCLSPTGKVFSFADASGVSPSADPVYFYFSRRFNQPEVAAYYRSLIAAYNQQDKSPRWHYFMAIPWYDNAAFAGVERPKLAVFEGINDLFVFNGSSSTPHSVYLIAKTGDPDMAHQQLDVGTFVIESDGVRWIDELGSESYGLPNFWDYRPDGQRWKYFRNNSLSHNTLSIDGKIQYSYGTGEALHYDADAPQPTATMDMTTVYTDQAASVHRTFAMPADDRMIVTDSVELLSAGQSLRWSAVTAAAVSCQGNIAELTKDGKTFKLKILSPAGATFTTRPANDFVGQGEKSNDGYTIVSVTVSGALKQVISVQMSVN